MYYACTLGNPPPGLSILLLNPYLLSDRAYHRATVDVKRPTVVEFWSKQVARASGPQLRLPVAVPAKRGGAPSRLIVGRLPKLVVPFGARPAPGGRAGLGVGQRIGRANGRFPSRHLVTAF